MRQKSILRVKSKDIDQGWQKNKIKKAEELASILVDKLDKALTGKPFDVDTEEQSERVLNWKEMIRKDRENKGPRMSL